MSSDLYVFDGSFYHHSSPEMMSSDGDLFFSDPFSPFSDSYPFEFLQELSTNSNNNNQNTQNPVHDSSSTDYFSPGILSSSPPSQQLENLTLYQATHLQQPLENSGSNLHGYENFSGLDALEVKVEECQLGFDNFYDHHHNSFVPHSYSGVENAAKYMQRSYSSNSFDGTKPDNYIFQPRFDTLMESPDYQNRTFSSPENISLGGQMRRVCSTGDLQNIRSAPTARSFSSPLAAESSFTEESNFKVGRYSAEERKERISKYRAKRNQRNFTKTIKYACRKTLADNRPRIRGRFARNEETGEIPKAASSNRDEDEEELWFDGLHEEEDDHGGLRTSSSGSYVNSYSSQAQFQYNSGYGYGG